MESSSLLFLHLLSAPHLQTEAANSGGTVPSSGCRDKLHQCVWKVTTKYIVFVYYHLIFMSIYSSLTAQVLNLILWNLFSADRSLEILSFGLQYPEILHGDVTVHFEAWLEVSFLSTGHKRTWRTTGRSLWILFKVKLPVMIWYCHVSSLITSLCFCFCRFRRERRPPQTSEALWLDVSFSSAPWDL